MKKFILIIICCNIIFCCEELKKRDCNIKAEILTINKNILQGKIIGDFLSSASGKFSNDNIKIGVKFNVCDILFLEDLEVQHAELAYYKDVKEIPLYIYFYDYGRYIIYLNHRRLKDVYIDYNIIKNISKCLNKK